jgi:hypothetical protein
MITDTDQFAPVTLLNPAIVGTNFQFSFISTASHTDYVQYSTNLANTTWLNYTNFVRWNVENDRCLGRSPAAEFLVMAQFGNYPGFDRQKRWTRFQLPRASERTWCV